MLVVLDPPPIEYPLAQVVAMLAVVVPLSEAVRLLSRVAVAQVTAVEIGGELRGRSTWSK